MPQDYGMVPMPGLMPGMEFEGSVPVGSGDRRETLEAQEVRMWLGKVSSVQTHDMEQYRKFHDWTQTLAGDRKQNTSVLAEQTLPGKLSAVGTSVGGRTNLIYSIFAAALPHIYDQSTDVHVSPARAVDDLHYELARGFAETSSIVLKRRFVMDTDLQGQMRCVAQATMATGIGWLKLAYARDFRNEPILTKRPDDAQDELARVEQITRQLPEETDDAVRYALVNELQNLYEVLFREVQVVTKEGLVLDRVDAVDMVVSPEVGDILEGYEQAEWLAQGRWFTVAEAATRFNLNEEERRTLRLYSLDTKMGIGGLVPDLSNHDRAGKGEFGYQDEGGQQNGFARAWEIWDRRGMRVLTAVDGLRRWAKPPFIPPGRPARWFPFYAIGFNPIRGMRYPISDVELLKALQDEFHETRTKYMEHRKATIPKTAINSAMLSAPAAQRYADAPVGSIVPLEGATPDPSMQLDHAFFVPRYAIPPAEVYETHSIERLMEKTFGMGDAQVGTVQQPKTATEARQIEAAVQGRLGERTVELTRMETMMARDALEMLLQEIPPEAVQRIAGMSATWPVLDRNAIEDLVAVEVSHLSEGEKEIKRIAWMEIAPQLQQMVMTVAQLRFTGMDVIAEPLIEIMRETLRRLDERIDVERFLPGGPVQAGQPLPPPVKEAAASAVEPITAEQLMMLNAIAGSMGGGGGAPMGGGGQGATGAAYTPGGSASQTNNQGPQPAAGP